MRKLPFLPDSDGYSFTDPQESVMVSLDGGPPRVRTDILNGVITLTASWTLDRQKYDYMRAFYRVTMEKYGGKFRCDLVIDDSTLTEHDCVFVPGSMKLASQRGHAYVVNCQMIVVPIPMDIDYEDSKLDMIDAYGTEPAALDVMNELDELANVRLGAI